MQIGIRLHDTKPVSLEERLQIVKEQGFTCAHVALSKVIKEFPVDNGALTPGLAMYLKKLFWDKGIDLAVFGCYLNLAHPDPVQLSKIQNTYLAHIRFASILGCGVVGTETGAPNAEYKYEPACRSEEALRLFIRNLRPVVAYAQAMGVILAIEPVRNHIVYDARRAKRVLEEIASPNLQIILDPVNLLGMDNYVEQTEVVEEAIDLLGDDVVVIHMKDFIVRDASLVSVAAGTGQLNYKPVIDFIRERKPFIHCTLEDTTPENAVAARKYISNMYRNA
ncbi:MAG TPA: sugar phosphate isomerase/epimerase [Lachnospiraceae bacterium]|jgi:sugar phosphate isomerase/epimerase|nr:sugar phosphate isomerase/epimerase [Lachnospiraceae bacterium]HCR40603.1 sugar phosphate isomerase/epimerase [Lachnospiraceae bacterium]